MNSVFHDFFKLQINSNNMSVVSKFQKPYIFLVIQHRHLFYYFGLVEITFRPVKGHIMPGTEGRGSKKSQVDNSRLHRQSHLPATMTMPMNTATDNYTCEERLTAAGKVHRVHEGRVVQSMKSLPRKNLNKTSRTTHKH
jgi:hypothetical protein